MSYWNEEGKYQAQYEELIKLVPREGEIKKGMCKHVFSLERFRKACATLGSITSMSIGTMSLASVTRKWTSSFVKPMSKISEKLHNGR